MPVSMAEPSYNGIGGSFALIVKTILKKRQIFV
jgi:hypothetical protein